MEYGHDNYIHPYEISQDSPLGSPADYDLSFPEGDLESPVFDSPSYDNSRRSRLASHHALGQCSHHARDSDGADNQGYYHLQQSTPHHYTLGHHHDHDHEREHVRSADAQPSCPHVFRDPDQRYQHYHHYHYDTPYQESYETPYEYYRRKYDYERPAYYEDYRRDPAPVKYLNSSHASQRHLSEHPYRDDYGRYANEKCSKHGGRYQDFRYDRPKDHHHMGRSSRYQFPKETALPRDSRELIRRESRHDSDRRREERHRRHRHDDRHKSHSQDRHHEDRDKDKERDRDRDRDRDKHKSKEDRHRRHHYEEKPERHKGHDHEERHRRHAPREDGSYHQRHE